LSISLHQIESMDQKVRQFEVCTQDGSVDRHGNPAIRANTGKWLTAILILGNDSLSLSLYIYHCSLS